MEKKRNDAHEGKVKEIAVQSAAGGTRGLPLKKSDEQREGGRERNRAIEAPTQPEKLRGSAGSPIGFLILACFIRFTLGKYTLTWP